MKLLASNRFYTYTIVIMAVMLSLFFLSEESFEQIHEQNIESSIIEEKEVEDNYLPRPKISSTTLTQMNQWRPLPEQIILEEGPLTPAFAIKEQKEFPDVAGYFADEEIYVTERQFADIDSDGQAEELWNLTGPWMNGGPHGFVVIDGDEIVFSYHVKDFNRQFDSAGATFTDEGTIRMFGSRQLKYHLSIEQLEEIMKDSNILPSETEVYDFAFSNDRFILLEE